MIIIITTSIKTNQLQINMDVEGRYCTV